MESQVISLSVHLLYLDISWDILTMVDKRSDIQKTQPNVDLMRQTVTPFNSLLSSEWFFLALSRRASGWKQTWWSRSVFELHGPETMFQLSASVQTWIWSLSTTQSVKIQLMRPPERQKKKERVCLVWHRHTNLLHVPKWGSAIRCQGSLFALVGQYVHRIFPISPETALNIPYEFSVNITHYWNYWSVAAKHQSAVTESCLDYCTLDNIIQQLSLTQQKDKWQLDVF